MQIKPAKVGNYRNPTWVLLAAGAFCAAGTFAINMWRYSTFRVAGPFDLAYFNQQHWNIWHGMAPLTIRPQIAYAAEGPEPWRTMRLRPITLLLTLFYPLAPGVPLLFAFQSAAIGLGVLPAFLLGRRVAGGDVTAGLLAAAAYAIAPPVWVLGTNDFRYLYLGLPLVFCLYCSIRAGSGGATAFWALALLCVRSPYCILVALLGLASLFNDGRTAQRLKWCLGLLALAVFWLVLTVLYLYLLFGPTAAAGYVEAMFDPIRYYGRNPGSELAELEREWPRLLLVLVPAGLVAWSIPELAIAALLLFYPPLRMGLFTLHPAQQYVRFLAPALAMLLLASSAGLAKVWSRERAHAGRRRLAGVALAAMAASSAIYLAQLFMLPPRVHKSDIAKLKEAMSRIKRQDAVLAFRALLPNLSSRTVLYDYYQMPDGLTVEAAAATVDWAFVEMRQRALIEYLKRREYFETRAELAALVVLSRKRDNARSGLRQGGRPAPAAK